MKGQTTAYIVGGGIAGLAAAVFLIRDAGLKGAQVRILEELPVVGGSLDGAGDPERGYVTRGGRMLEEEAYSCQEHPVVGADIDGAAPRPHSRS